MSETKTKKTAVPPDVAAPQDHLPKKDKTGGDRTVTVRGQQWTIPADALNDFELLDDLSQVDVNGDVSRLPSLLRRLLGDQFRAAMNTCRDENTGRVTVESGADFTREVMEALNPNS